MRVKLTGTMITPCNSWLRSFILAFQQMSQKLSASSMNLSPYQCTALNLISAQEYPGVSSDLWVISSITSPFLKTSELFVARNNRAVWIVRYYYVHNSFLWFYLYRFYKLHFEIFLPYLHIKPWRHILWLLMIIYEKYQFMTIPGLLSASQKMSLSENR